MKIFDNGNCYLLVPAFTLKLYNCFNTSEHRDSYNLTCNKTDISMFKLSQEHSVFIQPPVQELTPDIVLIFRDQHAKYVASKSFDTTRLSFLLIK